MFRKEDERLLKALAAKGLVNKEELKKLEGAFEHISQTGISRTLVQKLNIDERVLAQVIAEEFETPIMQPMTNKFWISVSGLPDEDLSKLRVLPIIKEEKEITIAFIDPPYQWLIDLLSKATGKRILPVTITVSEFDELIHRRKNAVAFRSPKFELAGLDVQKNGKNLEENQNMPPAANVLSKIIENAVLANTSDIHVATTREGYLEVKYRIDGSLQRVVTLPKNYTTAIPSLIKQSGSIDTYQKHCLKQGQSTFQIRDRKVRSRVNIFPTSTGEKITLRLHGNGAPILKLDEIGLSKHDLSRVKYFLTVAKGLALFAGPAGCGKTTTLFAAMRELSHPSRNVISIEDPIETQLNGITQASLEAFKEIPLSDGMRALFHHDLDALIFGEIHNEQEANALVEAGLAGIFTCATIQAHDALGTLVRLQHLGLERQILSTAIEAIVAQRLVRKVCPNCAQTYRPDIKSLARLGLLNLPPDIELTKGQGCASCLGTGYQGRIPLFEVLLVNDEVSGLIADNRPLSEVKRAAEDFGFTSMRYDGLRKALAGLTTVDEIMRVT